MKEYQFISEEYEIEYMGREYIMEIEITGSYYSIPATHTDPPDAGYENVHMEISNVMEWKNGGDYLEPILDEELIKEIKATINEVELLNMGEEC